MKTAKPKINVRLLRRIQKQILKEPRQFQMAAWFTTLGVDDIPNCGTAACIGGWAMALKRNWNPKTADERTVHEYSDAKKALGLDDIKGGRLFIFGEWPQQYQRVGKHKAGTKAFARQAVRRIDHFIKTRGRE